MTICKYFLRGSCRFGENCKNEHSYNENSTKSILHKKGEVDINVIVKAVHDDVDNSEKSGQWPLSCYGPFQGKPCIPGIDDTCFEEIRLQMYEAQKNGTLEQYKQQLASMIQQNKLKMKTLQYPSPEIRNLLQQLYNVIPGSQHADLFRKANAQNLTSNSSPLTSAAFSNTQQQTSNIFNNTAANNFTFSLPESKSIFGNTAATATPAPTTNIFNTNFNQNSSNVSGSIFSHVPTQSAASTNIFSNIQTPPSFNQNFTTNIFQNNTQPPPNSFATNVNQNIFATAQANLNSPLAIAPTQTSIFSNQQNPAFNALQPPPYNPQQPMFSNQQPFGNQETYGNIFAQNTQTFPQTSVDITDNTQPPQNNFAMLNPTSIFQTNSQVPQNTNIFGAKVNTSNTLAKTGVKFDSSIYSKLQDLNNNDIKCFEAVKFEFGNIPEIAPPLELC